MARPTPGMHRREIQNKPHYHVVHYRICDDAGGAPLAGDLVVRQGKADDDAGFSYPTENQWGKNRERDIVLRHCDE
jgi:hypothetical protein